MIAKNNIPNRYPDEEVVFHLRRHWFVFFLYFLYVAILVAIPPMIAYFLPQILPDFLAGEIGRAVKIVLFLSYYLIIMVFALTIWTDNYLDVLTVTNYRIIHREQNGLFNRVVSQVYLEEIQDVTSEQKGILPTIMHYGEVYVQTAAEKIRFVFEQIPHPYQTAKIIQQLNEKAKKNSPQKI